MPDRCAGSDRSVFTGEICCNRNRVSKEELLSYMSELKKSQDTFDADKAETLLAEMNGLAYQEIRQVNCCGKLGGMWRSLNGVMLWRR